MAGVDGSDQRALHSEQTLELGSSTKKEADWLTESGQKSSVSKRRQTLDLLKKSTGCCSKCRMCMLQCQKFLISCLGEDWIFLILLGLFMGFLSWAMDCCIETCLEARRVMYDHLDSNVLLSYIAWVTFPLVLISFAAGFTQFVAPEAAGSGIPEMKTILRGVMLKKYLTFKTFAVKFISLAFALGSGMPLGKESPFVHMSSLCASLLFKFMSLFGASYEHRSRKMELLAVACGVGVCSCFAAPIGGVLFSIEVTTTFFAVRNYWRAILAATLAAIVYRVLPVWASAEETITALFKTHFPVEFPFHLYELPVFAGVGIACGFGGALFVYLFGLIIRFTRKKTVSKFFMKRRLLYPALVTLLVSSLTFPPGFGQFMAGKLAQNEALVNLLDNQTWAKQGTDWDSDHTGHSEVWKSPQNSVFMTLALFTIAKFLMTVLSITMPVPYGAFMPTFIVGAGFGRLVGEGMAAWFPDGIHTNGSIYPIVPGSYAIVGAASLSGAVTHTVSTAIMVIELTGQITHILPVIVAVILANAVAQSLQPSIYDFLIRIKKLPYLPELGWGHHDMFNIRVKDFMKRDVKYITSICCYKELHNVLMSAHVETLALVESAESMILMGSIERSQLQSLLSQQLSRSRRLEYIKERAAAEEKHLSVVSDSNSDAGPQKASQEIHFKEDGDVEDEMTYKEIAEWEEKQLDEQVDFSSCKIEEFQLAENTSLYKTHTIFSLVGLDHIYVTCSGRLVGVVSLQELSEAIKGSVKVKGAKVPRPLTSLRDSGTGTSEPEATELHKLWDCPKNKSLPCEHSPSKSNEKSQ
ncbi:chloride channel protein 2 [Nothobranchius furzeri]|uniref:chloride channel protein 2 n=1 Tax=Nothobranchius furzeri TaxID=105023 RepID=UPI002404641B|nr:chloride channel protein 2 [Nothobranchius furzeri]